MPKDLIFDNEKVQTLVGKYNSNGAEPLVLGEILSETHTLISVITSKYSQGDIDQEDLMQEARLKLIKAIPKFDGSRGTKAYSFFSTVIRNAAVDYVRKLRTDSDIDEYTEDLTDGIDDLDFISILVEDMREWFVSRFPTIMVPVLASDILECVIGDLLDENCGTRKAITNLEDDYEYSRIEARIIYRVVLMRLRSTMARSGIRIDHLEEVSLEPELHEIVGDDHFQELSSIFKGLSIKIRNN